MIQTVLTAYARVRRLVDATVVRENHVAMRPSSPLRSGACPGLRSSARSRAARAAIALGAAAALALACTTDYQKGLGDPKYGDPNALEGIEAPGTTSEILVDSGTTGGGGGAPACVQNGGSLVDGGACVVTFTSILANFKIANCHTSSCHGGATPPSQPRINPDDPNTTWAEFASFKLRTGAAYINPCSTDPTQSTIGCNVDATKPCGTLMPLGSAGLPANVISDIDTWLKCGAPNN